MKKYNFLKISKLIVFALFLISFSFSNFRVSAANNNSKKEIIKCKANTASSFAIFVDSKTYTECKEELFAYKNVLEEEGLGTYIVSAAWSNPEEVKLEIAKLAAKKPALEGMVFIGNIPIVRVRAGQHLTTAFKMNEKTFPMEESSVSSDRYYDCPNLKFDFICKDSLKANHFYYKLLAEGAQRLSPAYYSARILVPAELVTESGKDEYSLMRAYLKKVVAAHKETNYLDKYTFFAGNGYNSDCLTAWRQQSTLLKTYFPNASETMLNFRQGEHFKYELYTYMQDPRTDIFLFYEHGSPNKQHINESASGRNLDENLSALKFELRTYTRRLKGEKRTAYIKDVCAHFGLLESELSDDVLMATAKADSTRSADKDMNLKDLSKLKTGSRVTIFNACYNGSFHKDGYVAGYHIFNDGKTVVTQGNTVNVLQDKWEDQLFGMFALGARIGFWQKEVQTLESHLIGDPTYRFSINKDNYPSSAKDATRAYLNGEINKFLAPLSYKPSTNTSFWESELNNPNANVRALAIKQLLNNYLNGGREDKTFASKIYKIFEQDRFSLVRIQAITALSYTDSELFIKAVEKGLSDSSELIRRLSAHWSGKIGAPSLFPSVINLCNNSADIQRVNYAAMGAIPAFGIEEPIKVGQKLDYKSAPKGFQLSNKILKIDLNDPRVEDNIRRLRNVQNYPKVEELFTILNNSAVSLDIRLMLCEAIGWMNFSIHKNKVIDGLGTIIVTKETPLELREEALKSKKRLEWQ